MGTGRLKLAEACYGSLSAFPLSFEEQVLVDIGTNFFNDMLISQENVAVLIRQMLALPLLMCQLIHEWWIYLFISGDANVLEVARTYHLNFLQVFFLLSWPLDVDGQTRS